MKCPMKCYQKLREHIFQVWDGQVYQVLGNSFLDPDEKRLK